MQCIALDRQGYADQSDAIHKSVVLSNGRCHESGNDTLALAKCPDRVVNRIEILAVWWPVLQPDEVRRLGRQQFNRFCEHAEPGHCLVET